MEKENLLSRIRKDRAAFAALWEGLSSEQMTAHPGPQDDWSVKDLIAHIVWWEKLMMRNVEAVNAGQKYEMVYDIDGKNAIIFAQYKDRDLAEVLDEFEANLEPMMTAINTLTDEQLNHTQLPKYPLLDHIIGDSYGHYKLHRDDLEGYCNRVKSTS
jgi:uncharacterized protein (TIGR03083 family)